MKSADCKTLTPKETAKELGVSVDTVYKLIKSRELPCLKFGAIYKIPKIQLEAILKGNK